MKRHEISRREADYWYRTCADLAIAHRRAVEEKEKWRMQAVGYQRTTVWALALIGAQPETNRCA